MTKKQGAATRETKKKASPSAPAKAPAAQESRLAKFLKERRDQRKRNETVHDRLARWKDAVDDLMNRFKAVLAPAGDQVEVETWNVLLKEENVPYNATALTIDFGDQNIVVEPKGLNVEGVGVVTAMSGARSFRFLWTEGQQKAGPRGALAGWRFEWINPERHAPAEPVTSEALELVIEALLA